MGTNENHRTRQLEPVEAGAAGRRSAIVVGGGVGGLAAAIGLRRIGWTATVLEQAPELRAAGSGWSFARNGEQAADALGFGEEFRACSVPTQAAANLLTPSGRYLMRFRPGRDTPLLANHRADMQRVLLDRLPAGWVRTGAEVTGVEEAGDQVTVTYRTAQGPQRAAAEVLVAADGIHSTVRRLLWPEAPPPVFQRITCWRGVTEPGSVWPVDGFQTWGRGQRVGTHPLPNRRVYWFLTIRQDRPGVRYDDNLAEVRRRIGGWHQPIPALLAATRPEAVLCHDIFDLDPLPSYARGRVALLGDAAHAMTPFAAQGAGQALEDATVLAARLAGGAPVPEALAGYDRDRRPRSQRVAHLARTDPRISLSTNPLTWWLMTGLTRLSSSRLAERKTAWLWEWTPPQLAEGPAGRGRAVREPDRPVPSQPVVHG
jgi:2-polyprenyl-6-methoxyphenol hydroxylase-like FAD-dependent oxidoreductase